MLMRFRIELRRFVRPGAIDGGVETFRRKSPTPNDQLPGPFDRFLLEIIAKAPVPEHLEKGVVIGVESDVVEIVVFASSPDAFLGVGGARRIPSGLLLAEKDRDELIHPRVGEKQVGRVGEKR